MPDLMTSLQGQDLGHFRILAEQWGIELNAPDAQHALEKIIPQILEKVLISEVVGALPEDTRRALHALAANDGRMSWVRFTQRYGEVRQWGAGRRDRERPDLHPVSAAERLWYLALVARANLDTPDGPVEFAYIPDDILGLLPAGDGKKEILFGWPASAAESAFPVIAGDNILDDGCSLLAALRSNLPVRLHFVPRPFLTALLIEGGILDDEDTPNIEEGRRFLEMPRAEALRLLVQAWLNGAINDLRMLPSLEVEGELENHPERTRRFVLDLLSTIKEERWWNIGAFIEAIRENQPDFQRPTGDYDTWYLRDRISGQFLRGFEHWNAVEGALLHYLLEGPLHWLGLLELASPGQGMAVSAFRMSPWAKALIHNEMPKGLVDEDLPLQVHMDGRIDVPRPARRIVRYQLARFTLWDEYKQDLYHYRLTPATLARAAGQGLTVNHLLTLLNNHAQAVPPMLIKALQRWERQGTEVRLETLEVLRSESPDVLQNLRKSPAGRYLGNALGVNSVIVKPGAGRHVLAALAEMGILGEVGESADKAAGKTTDPPDVLANQYAASEE